MEGISRSFSLLFVVFLLLGLIYNLLAPKLPRIPGDIYINKSNFKIYIPFVSAIIISVILAIMLDFFRK